MKHFIDNLNNVSNQTFDTALITDSKGKPAGKIVVRYTNASIGYNHQLAVLLYGDNDFDYSNTSKGNTYRHDTLFDHLKTGGTTSVYGSQGQKFITYADRKRVNGQYQDMKKGEQMSDSVSNCRDFVAFRFNGKKYNINWI